MKMKIVIDDIYFNICNYCNYSDCLIYITSRNDSKKNNEIDIEKKGLIKGHVYFIISCFKGDKIK